MDLIEILNEQGIELVNGIRANLGSTGTTATGKTSQSLRFEISQEGTKTRLKLFGRPFFMTVETGRKATPNKKPSREFIENLKPWAEARGIPEGAVWAIATDINKRGTALWRAGGTDQIVEPPVDTFINNVGQALLDSKADDLVFKIREIQP
jgi:methyl coenzyme M reductase alpha subunit